MGRRGHGEQARVGLVALEERRQGFSASRAPVVEGLRYPVGQEPDFDLPGPGAEIDEFAGGARWRRPTHLAVPGRPRPVRAPGPGARGDPHAPPNRDPRAGGSPARPGDHHHPWGAITAASRSSVLASPANRPETAFALAASRNGQVTHERDRATGRLTDLTDVGLSPSTPARWSWPRTSRRPAGRCRLTARGTLCCGTGRRRRACRRARTANPARRARPPCCRTGALASTSVDLCCGTGRPGSGPVRMTCRRPGPRPTAAGLVDVLFTVVSFR